MSKDKIIEKMAKVLFEEENKMDWEDFGNQIFGLVRESYISKATYLFKKNIRPVEGFEIDTKIIVGKICDIVEKNKSDVGHSNYEYFEKIIKEGIEPIDYEDE